MVRYILLFFVFIESVFSAYMTPDSIASRLYIKSTRTEHSVGTGVSIYNAASCSIYQSVTGCYAIGGVGSEDTTAIVTSTTDCRCYYKTPSTAGAVCIKVCSELGTK